MPTSIPSVHLGEDDFVALFAHGIIPRNETVFLQPLDKPLGEDPWVVQLANAVKT